MGAGRRNGFEKIGDLSKLGAAGAFVIEGAVADKRELGTMPRKFIDLAAIELERAQCLHRLEQSAGARTKPTVRC